MRKYILATLLLSFNVILGIDANAQFYVVKGGKIVYELEEGTADYITFKRPNLVSISNNKELEYVDLGLTSGTLWATTNIGAEKPEDFGDYLSWGEIAKHYASFDSYGDPEWENGQVGYNWDTYVHSDESGKFKKYVLSEKAALYGIKGKSDGESRIKFEDDVASMAYGGECQIPTKENIMELYDQCEWTWTDSYQETGVAGYIVSSKKEDNDNSIFLPASGNIWGTELLDVNGAGYYWTQELAEDRYDFATYCFFYEGYIGPWHNGHRYRGFSIRPVRKISTKK